MSDFRTRSRPFGFEHGDPLIVCVNDRHMDIVQNAFQLRAYYCLPLTALTGYRFGKIIMFSPGPGISYEYEKAIMRWKEECCMTSLGVGKSDQFFLI